MIPALLRSYLFFCFPRVGVRLSYTFGAAPEDQSEEAERFRQMVQNYWCCLLIDSLVNQLLWSASGENLVRTSENLLYLRNGDSASC